MSRSGTVYTTIYLPPITEYVPSTVYTTVYVPSYVTLPYYVPTAVGTTAMELEVFETLYYPYTEPLELPTLAGVAPPVVAGAVGYPGAPPPWTPTAREEAEAVARLRKPKELEKVVL